MTTMKPVKTTRRRRGCKNRKLSPKAPSGEQMLPDVDAESPEIPEKGLPALHAACFYGELARVQFLVESRPWWINSSDCQGRQPLHMVLSSRGSPNTHSCLRHLLEHGADVNATTDLGQTALHMAASEGLLECVETLIQAGADVMAEDNMGLTPLDSARIWCHRKVVRYLKNCLWEAKVEREQKERRLAQTLYRELVDTVNQMNINKKTLTDEVMAEWAKKKGLPPMKKFSPRVQVSKYHNRCICPDQMGSKPERTKNKETHQPEGLLKDGSSTTASCCSPWTIFMGFQPEKTLTEPDLRDSVHLWKDNSSQKLQYSTTWGGTPHPIPNLPLDVVERVLFPRVFPSRITTPQDFKPLNIEEVQHRGHPQGRSSTPWTEVAMHLAEVLEPGHY